MVVFDSNAILRYILQDNEEMAAEVEKQINKSVCFIPTEVVAEMAYVLTKVYKIPRDYVSAAIIGVLNLDNVATSCYGVVETGLRVFANTKLDFVDCLMAGYQKDGYDIFTFDKELIKHLQKI